LGGFDLGDPDDLAVFSDFVGITDLGCFTGLTGFPEAPDEALPPAGRAIPGAAFATSVFAALDALTGAFPAGACFGAFVALRDFAADFTIGTTAAGATATGFTADFAADFRPGFFARPDPAAPSSAGLT
jgi:hypothetical protein